MFERFTAEARAVVIRAQEEAREFHHDHIGTEHILLGLFAMPTSIAALTLRKFGVTAATVRNEVEAQVGHGEHAPTGHIAFTKRAKKLLELSLREAIQLKHSYIGTEHILLAVAREGEGLGARIIATRVGDLRMVRAAVQEQLESNRREHPGVEPPNRTNAADEVVTTAQALAGDAPMGSHHLLEALVRAEGSMAAKVLSDLGVDAAAIAAKVGEYDTEDTTDATPEEMAARAMVLRVVHDEVRLSFHDRSTLELAKAVIELVGDPVSGSGPMGGRFVPVWKATNEMLLSLLPPLADASPPEGAGRRDAGLLVRRVLHDRERRRRQGE